MNEKEVAIKFTSKIVGEAKLEKYAQTLEKINALSNGMNKGTEKVLNESANDVAKMQKNTSALASASKKAFAVGSAAAFHTILKGLVTTTGRLTTKSMNYLETLNLYQVAFKEVGKSVEESTKETTKFINKMSEMYNLDESWLTETISRFKQLSNAMGLGGETGTKLSKILTQLSIDASSLYNVEPSEAVSKLISGMVGQTKPVRFFGADITEKTLAQTLGGLDIGKSIDQLSFTEKRLLIVISLMQQLRNATGDWGKTIESPANQTRILSQQWERLTRSLGNLLLPILSKILPILNGIIMALVEIFNFIGGIFGFDIKDFDYGVNELADDFGNLGASAGTASENVKKLKHGLRGFDKLNVITTPSSGSGGGAGGVGGGTGISPKLTQALGKAYDDYIEKLKQVKSRASEIRDQILEWLGFTIETDEETGDLKIKFEKITGGTILGALAVGGTIFKGVSKIFGIFRSLGFMKFPIITNLIKSIGLGGKNANSALSAAGDITNTANSTTFGVPKISTVLKGLADVALIIAGTIVVVEAIGEILNNPSTMKAIDKGLEVIKKTFWGLAESIIPIAAFAAGVVVLGNYGIKQITSGMASLAEILAGVSAVVLAIGVIMSVKGFKDFVDTGVESIKKCFEGLSDVIIPIAAMSAIIVGLGFASPKIVLAGIAGLAGVIIGTEAIFVAIGALRKIKGFDDLVNGGIEGLKMVFKGIGDIAGSLIAAFAKSATSTLPDIGTNLADFMINAKPFFDTVGKIGADTFKSVKYLASALLAFTATDVLDGLLGWVKGESSIKEFGEMLPDFGKNMMEFAENVKGLDTNSVKTASTAAKMINEFARGIPNEGGLWGLIAGENNLEKFGKMLPSFATNLSKFATNAVGINEQVVKKASNAAKTVIAFAVKIPNEGGLLSWLVGDNSIKNFGSQLPAFGSNLKKYSDNIGNIDSGLITSSANAAKAISALANDLPFEKNWFVKLFTSNQQSLSSFGEQVAKFGTHMKTYNSRIKGLDTDKMFDVSGAIAFLVTQLEKIKDGGLTKTLESFGKAMETAGTKMKKFFDNTFDAKTAYTYGLNTGNNIASGIETGLKNNLKMNLNISDPTTGSNVKKYKMTASTYAQGGLPPVGQLFVANERGPELVGHIGGQSFVANQNQMMDLLDKKIGGSGTTNATIIVKVGDEEISKHVINNLQDMAKTNGRPIEIG